MRLLQLSLIPLLVACDTEPSGPLGPSGGENRLSITVDEKKEPFDEVDLEVRSTRSGVVTLALSGSVDPLKDAIDDEYSLHLLVDLDKAALIAMAAPGDLALKGAAEFTAGAEAVAPEVITYTFDPSSSPIVKGVFFRRSCFCADQGSGEQTFEGSIAVEQVSDTEITGTLTLRLQGDVPNYGRKIDATLTASFNLAIP
jgi:hypothetical protein